MIYQVSADSKLGQRLNDYYNLRERCEAAQEQFILHDVSEKYGFIPCDYSTDIIEPSESECGGLLGIKLPIDAIQGDGAVFPDPSVWAHLDAPDGRVYYPRIVARSHYIRYGESLSLLNDPTWVWRMPTDMEIADYEKETGKMLDPKQPFPYKYKDVQLFISTTDDKAIEGKYGHKASPSTRLAHGMNYTDVLPEDRPTLNGEEVPLDFDRALRLHSAVVTLPYIPSGRLARILQPTKPEAFSGKLALEHCFDVTTNRFYIKTDLQLAAEGIQLATDLGICALFKA